MLFSTNAVLNMRWFVELPLRGVNKDFRFVQKYKGYDDPWDMMPVKRIVNSSPENPNLLPSSNDKRLMACICK